MRNGPAMHEIDEHRSEPGLHDVTAQHNDDGALVARGVDDGGDDAAQIAGDEDVGERVEKCAEGTVVARRSGELVRAHLVWAAGDGHGSNVREVGLTRRRAGCA